MTVSKINGKIIEPKCIENYIEFIQFINSFWKEEQSLQIKPIIGLMGTRSLLLSESPLLNDYFCKSSKNRLPSNV